MAVILPVARPAMSAPLFTPARSEAAMLRQWGAHDAHRLAIAIAWEIYDLHEAHVSLAATLAGHAERSRILTISCRKLAADMLGEAIHNLEQKHHALRERMITAATQRLPDRMAAASAAADLAREANAPPALIDQAFNFALWRAKRRA